MTPVNGHDSGQVDQMVAARREEGLRQLRGVVVKRGQRRVIRAAAGGGALVVLVLVAAVGLSGAFRRVALPSRVATKDAETVVSERATEVVPPVPLVNAGPSATPDRGARVELVQTRVGMSKLLQVTTKTEGGTASDDDLIAALYETGQEPELVRVGRRVVIAGDLGRK